MNLQVLYDSGKFLMAKQWEGIDIKKAGSS
jgi:hypothetical protein